MKCPEFGYQSVIGGRFQAIESDAGFAAGSTPRAEDRCLFPVAPTQSPPSGDALPHRLALHCPVNGPRPRSTVNRHGMPLQATKGATAPLPPREDGWSSLVLRLSCFRRGGRPRVVVFSADPESSRNRRDRVGCSPAGAADGPISAVAVDSDQIGRKGLGAASSGITTSHRFA